MTAQLMERLIFDGVDSWMASSPPLPEGHLRVVESESDPDQESSIYESSACWRGYQATWEIREGRFYLADLEAAQC